MQAKQFVVAVEPGQLKALGAVVKTHRDAERQWLAEIRKDFSLASLRGPDATEARQKIRLRQAKLRTSGKLRGTADLVIAHETKAVLRARRLDRTWNPVPPKDSGAKGRQTGTASSRYPRTEDGEPALTGRLAVRLPVDLGEQIVRAAYWHSAPAAEALRAWQKHWGDGPVVMMREAQRSGLTGDMADLAAILAGMAPRATVVAIAERIELQNKILTTGDILREALKRAIS